MSTDFAGLKWHKHSHHYTAQGYKATAFKVQGEWVWLAITPDKVSLPGTFKTSAEARKACESHLGEST